MTFTRDRLQTHIAAAETLAAHDIAPPPEWTALRARFNQFMAADKPCLDALTTAILDGGTDQNLDLLRAAALGESAGDLMAVSMHIRAHVNTRLVELYDPAAPANYRTAGRHFDALTRDFAQLARTVDVDGDPGAVMHVDEKARKAWLAAEDLAAELDEALDVLGAAAILADAELDDDMEVVRLPLVVRTSGLHRRRVWEAWEATGRTGRWGALTKLGAKIGAAEHPEHVSAYSRPPAIGVRFIRDYATLGGGHRMEPYDPCDDEKPRMIDRVKAALVGAPAPTDADDWSVD
jgi:hypothetical protein